MILNFSRLLILAAICISCGSLSNSTDYSSAWVCAHHPEKVQQLFDALNLDYPGLENVKKAVKDEELAKACDELIKYYEQSATGRWIQNSRSVEKTWTLLSRDTTGPLHTVVRTDGISNDSIANNMLRNIHSYKVYSAALSTRPDGGIDWHDTGPYNDDEFAWNLNRHYFLVNLLEAWRETGNEIYPIKFNELIIDWVVSNAPVDTMTQSAAWRELETGRRLPASWSKAFYGFQKAEAFSPAARILMLASIVDHANYLTRFYKKHHNKATTALYGLASAACFWPEFKDKDFWLERATEGMVDEIEHQIYPDNMQIELTSSYYISVAERFDAFADMIEFCDKELPDGFRSKVEGMFDYMVYSSAPTGHAVMNNDSDATDNRKDLMHFAEKYDRDDWKYILTSGESGSYPERNSSDIYPWGGQLISRNSWEEDAHWSVFDIGPWGRAHQHHDALNLVVSAYGQDLLVDPGRFTYNINLRAGGAMWRSFFVGSAAHNVILFDGKGQNPGKLIAEEPVRKDDYLISRKFDFARGTFDHGFALDGWADEVSTRGLNDLPLETTAYPRHTRNVIYLKDRFWLVIDHIEVEESHLAEVLWHFHPECQLAVTDQGVSGVNVDRANLEIQAVGNLDWEVKLSRGDTLPKIQGWYGPSMKVKEPATTSIFSTTLSQNSTFAWLLIPKRDNSASAVHVSMTREEEKLLFNLTNGDENVNIYLHPTKGHPEVVFE